MIRILASIGLVILPTAWLVAADITPAPSTGKVAENRKSAFASEQKTSDKPIRVEQDCPSPEMIDVIKSSSWNTVELGVSIPVGEGVGVGQLKPYSRYTCPAPRGIEP